MSSIVNSPNIVILDKDGGDSVTVTGSRLDVNLDTASLDALEAVQSAIESMESTVGQDNNTGPSRTLSIGGTESGGNIQEIRVDSDGHLQVDVLSASSVGVTGTVTANLSATDNAVLDSILAKNTEIDDVLDTIKVDTEAIETAVELLDNAISGSEMQVDVVASLPAGSNNIGDVDIASIAAGDNNIGNVDIASALPAGDNNIGNVDIASSLPAGTNNIGDVDIASALPAGTNNIGDVDIASSLPAGSNAIGKLAANSGVDIGDVDVTSTTHATGMSSFESYAAFEAATTPTAINDSSNGINSDVQDAKEIIIQAAYGNSSYFQVGDSGAAANSNGVRLNAGDTLILPVADTGSVYIDGAVSSQMVCVTIVK